LAKRLRQAIVQNVPSVSGFGKVLDTSGPAFFWFSGFSAFLISAGRILLVFRLVFYSFQSFS
jgi:hypothetical protein